MRNILLAALLFGPAAIAQLRITVFDQTHLPQAIREDTFIALRDVFHASGINIELISGDLSAPEASLLPLPQPPRKGQERDAACRARRDIALEIAPAARPGLKATILGQAEPLARYGLNARVYRNRIMDAAAFHNRDEAAVLAHVIAHEIGHVLLRTNQHNPRGLMSEVWTDLEYRWIAVRALLFTKAQAQIMRATLDSSGCVSAASGN